MNTYTDRQKACIKALQDALHDLPTSVFVSDDEAAEVLAHVESTSPVTSETARSAPDIEAAVKALLGDKYCPPTGKPNYDWLSPTSADRADLEAEGEPDGGAGDVLGEPVAWRYLTPTGWHATAKLDKALGASVHHDMEPLYAAPSQRDLDARTELEVKASLWDEVRIICVPHGAGVDKPITEWLSDRLGEPSQPAASAVDAAPVAWRHSLTHCLYETESEVPLADGDEWAVPLYLAAPSQTAAPADELPIKVSDELHPDTAKLVRRFARSLANKLLGAQRKYGYGAAWANEDWQDECRADLMKHIAKGDPRDVAAYCAFMWHHNWSTAAQATAAHAGAHDPIYQQRDQEEVHVWHDTTKRVYSALIPELRRIVYASAPVAAHAGAIGRKLAEAAAQATAAHAGAALTEEHRRTLFDLHRCFMAWEPQVRVLGDVRADDAANAIYAVLAPTPVADSGATLTDSDLRALIRKAEDKLGIVWFVPDDSETFAWRTTNTDERDKFVRALLAAAKPVSDERFTSAFLADVMTAAGLVSSGRKCKALASRLSEGCMRIYMAKPVSVDAGLIDETRESLECIRRYGLDTLSGRVDGPDDRDWQRESVNEMTKRARLAIERIDRAALSATKTATGDKP